MTTAGSGFSTNRTIGKIAVSLVALIIGLLFLLPFVIMVFGSFSESTALSNSVFFWVPQRITFENYRLLFGRKVFINWLINSSILSIIPMACTVITSLLAGYIFAKKSFPGKELVFWMFLSMIMIPTQVLAVPRYLMFSRINWIDTYNTILIPFIWDISSLFYMRQYMQSIPNEIEEAATIDGSGQFRTLLSIIMPMCKPAMASIAILRFVYHWNDFFYPLIFLTTEKKYPITVGLASIMSESPNFSYTMAGAVMNFLPTFLVFILLQRYFIEGVSTAGLKG